MKRTLFQRVMCMLLSLMVLLGSFAVTASAASAGVSDTNPKGDESTSSTLEEMQALIGTLSYAEYLEMYADAESNDLDVIVLEGDALVNSVSDTNENAPGSFYVTGNSDACITSKDTMPNKWENFDWEANKNSTVYLPALAANNQAGNAQFTVSVPEGKDGLYYIEIQYYSVHTGESSVSSIERKFKIDGKVPFDEISTINLDKSWAYDNVTKGLPTPAPADAVIGSTVRYETVASGDNAGYYKHVTRIYEEDGQKYQQLITYKIAQDINGNSMSPEAVQSPDWNTYICRDGSGFYDGYFSFFFSYGDHTITLEAEREPVIIKSITLIPANAEGLETSVKSYDEYIADVKAGCSNPNPAGGSLVKIEAEFPDSVSDSSVAPSNNNSSALNYPISPSAQLFNVIGETGYSAVGQWASYKFTVTETGFYKISMRYMQSALQGMFICRTLKLAGGNEYVYGLEDGSPTVPFDEAYRTRFNYDKKWQSEYLGYYDENNDKHDFEFYFEAGEEYTLTLECSLGDLKEYIQRVETALGIVNECYLKIIQLTGSDPDEYQSYNFLRTMPEVPVNLILMAIELEDVSNGLKELCGTTGSHIATLDTVARLLDTMGAHDGDDIAANMETLKTYLGTLGTWINNSKRGTLMIDSICVIPAEAEDSLPKANANFFESIWFEISSFIYSFFIEYDQMGLTYDPTEVSSTTIDVWLATGRDQSNIWRTTIDADGSLGFTSSTGVGVTLKLVTGGTLLPSILAGRGPDVYLGLGSADVINYAIRDAVICVSGDKSDPTDPFANFVYEFEDGTNYFSPDALSEDEMAAICAAEGHTSMREVSKSFDALTAYDSETKEGIFHPAAIRTLTLLEKSYGIPMTMGFAMMFYRMDILADLGLEVPQSWDQLLTDLSILQQNNMTIGVSYVSALDFMMYQMGGNMWKYTDPEIYGSEYAGAKIDLDSDIAIEAFQFVCSLYTEQSLPVSYDAANRFRTGEMPIVIGDYASIYNTLVVYATEIDGMWEFSSLPGSYEKATGDFNYDSLAGVTATVILNGCDEPLAAWQFVQWQTSADVQANYANRMVALIGPSAKYESANLDAIKDMSWTANEKAAIMNQMDHLDSIVNYPGSYIIARYMKFAFLDVYNDNMNARDAMMSYIDAINDEITRKREEFKDFNLEIVEKGEEPPTLQD